MRGRPVGRLADLAAGLLMLAAGAVGSLYAAEVPGLDPITVWPHWIWAVVFAVLGLALSALLGWRRTVLVVGFALLTGLLLNEEPWFVIRDAWWDRGAAITRAADERRLVSVVTVNCGGGDPGAVEDALALRPDIILVQESPGAMALERLMPAGWEFAGRGDCAVLVRGSLYATEHPNYLAHEMRVVRAVPERLGRPLTVISTHLVQPSLRTDIWRPEVWRRAAMLRQSRMAAVRHLLEQRDRYGRLPVIIGGDFNAGHHDSLLLPLLASGLTDAFAEAGEGWPNTITADYPMERIDYVWIDDHFEALSGSVEYTPHSDHRMVIVDVALRQPEPAYSQSRIMYSPN
ncbi:MAG: endonuclease/exonuclease/phosphatase family protein [Armatimonadota bacterium]